MTEQIMRFPLRIDGQKNTTNIVNAEGMHIAECWCVDTELSRKEGERVAAEMVRLLNLHDELVAELRNVARATPDAFGVSVDEFRREFVLWAQNRCRNLLSKVEAR